MDTHAPKFKIRLGLFIAGGTILFLITIFIIGRQKNLFNPVFKLYTNFHNVSGLKVGSNIRFSGIEVGTVDNIIIINDSTVKVDMLIQKDVQKFIKTDCEAGIGSAGIIGDRILIISQGSNEAPLANEYQYIPSKEPVETDAIMNSLKVTAYNAEIVSNELAEIMIKVNTGQGTIGRLISDTTMSESFNKTMLNIESSSKGLNENMNAAKENFLLRGYFRRKAEDKENLRLEQEAQKKKEQKAIDKQNKKDEKKKEKDK
jgi:phospholipid/cholesterol/gamma-HCH transport system substrate-binding protein